ncbi:hypothetical protein [Phytohabitans houttuyneae]|uniref:Bacterial mobilisation domain-containing protein n=1 Tax=Phytohabitans houttuyneae TaxID=1076126 RepID=A0A6V8KPL0_9ACTN|nr:hypothetical protein [Phytohabitans houttuyneae]GFJ85784.1 hypothetical protein Phou_099640 [Phytohabitans houttuyneae]
MLAPEPRKRPNRQRQGADRRHQSPGRERRVNLRLDPQEHHDVTAAATRLGLTPAGFCATAALDIARGTSGPNGVDSGTGLTRHELAGLQREIFAARTALTRVGNNLNQAVTALNASGQPPGWLQHAVDRCQLVLEQLDAAASAIHRRLP